MVDAATAAQEGLPDLDPVAQVSLPENAKPSMNVHDAARILAQARNAARQQAPVTQEVSAPEPATPEPESAPEADAAPPQEATGDDQEADPAPQEPPLDLPTSWQGEDSDIWNSLDPATQKTLLKQDQKAKEWVRRQELKTEAANKTLDAERLKMEQVRTQYEQALPALVEALQQSIAGDFPDIKTMDDVQNLARTDWARYIAWDASQKKLAVIAGEARAAQERQANDARSKFATFANEQDKLFIDKAPEFADQAKAAALQRAAVNTLKDIGFTDEELARKWAGNEDLSIRDHRFQLLVRDATRFREAQAAIKKPAAKPVPPVQRPGVAQPSSPPLNAQIAALQKQLSRTTSSMEGAKLAVQLQNLRRQAAER